MMRDMRAVLFIAGPPLRFSASQCWSGPLPGHHPRDDGRQEQPACPPLRNRLGAERRRRSAPRRRLAACISRRKELRISFRPCAITSTNRALRRAWTEGPSGGEPAYPRRTSLLHRSHIEPQEAGVPSNTRCGFIRQKCLRNGGRKAVASIAHANLTSWFFSGNDRILFPVAAKIALRTAGAATKIVGSPTPPQNPPDGMMIDSTFGISLMRIAS